MNISDSVHNISNISNVSQDYLNNMMENIKKAFDKHDKDLNGEISQNELIEFLDSNTKAGKFDRNLAKNIFSILDIDKNGNISVEEFTKSYVSIVENIKGQIKELEAHYKSEEKNKAKFDLQVKNNINEVLNDEELGPNSKLMIEIINIEYLKQLMSYDGIYINIRFGNREESTRALSISTNELVWQQKFEL